MTEAGRCPGCGIVLRQRPNLLPRCVKGIGYAPSVRCRLVAQAHTVEQIVPTVSTFGITGG